MKSIAILGSTGSIGVNTLNVARHLQGEIAVEALAAHRNIDLLEAQAREFNPRLIAVFDQEKARELQQRLPGHTVVAGMAGLKAVAACDAVQLVVAAMSGIIGLEPTLAAIEAGKDIGLANKETLVSAGALVMSRVAAKGVTLMPIDSEHSAIFQCLHHENRTAVERIILTCSGGPFWQYSAAQLDEITIEKALSHPTWKMGAKITIDSSTLMNKGLEVIEAHFLFDLPAEKIDVVIHPQSIIHSMVEFVDGSMLAQMSEPSMVVPIQYAITYPKRLPGVHPRFNFLKTTDMQFFPPDLQRFRCLKLAYAAMVAGGSMLCYMNGVNEVLVEKFIGGEISWKEIPLVLEELMQRHVVVDVDTLESVVAISDRAKREAHNLLSTLLSKYGTLTL